jgi:hypothetical protein
MDLKIALGWFFTVLGVILLALGIFSPGLRPATQPALTDTNINLYCGIGILAFGLFWLVMARFSRQRP